MQDDPNNAQERLVRRNRRTGLIVLLIVVMMIGLSFAAVPMYSLFCQVTGFGGTTQTALVLPDVVLDRIVKVRFNADKGRNMPWEFHADQLEIPVHLGEKGLASFTARNTAGHPVAGTALYNVTPLKAGKYFRKIQCFCFDEQILQPGQEVAMPVMFFVDPALNDDPGMEDVHTITLSYTFYETESEELEQALEAFYNDETGAIPDTKF